MTSRERVSAALNHIEPDRIPVDLGGTIVTGMHVSAVTRLRQAVLGEVGYRVKLIDPYQMLGEIDPKLRNALRVDVVAVSGSRSLFGFEFRDWKPFTLFDGTDVLVPGEFNVTTTEGGDLLIYPEGDTTVPPSGRMPYGGVYFDSIIRQEEIVEENLDPADNTEEFQPLSDEEIAHFKARVDEAYNGTDCAITLTVPGTGFGDIALVPGPWMKHPKGIRDVQEWYISTAMRRDYVRCVFERQCEVALENTARLIDELGDKVQVAFTTGTDFGTQRGLFMSRADYRDLFMPFHKQINDLIHQKSNWKTFTHTCGSVYDLIPDLIEAGFDILNPVQLSAAKMDAVTLKKEFGKDMVFWGGGVNTQQTLPFGTPEEVYKEVRDGIEILSKGGGFVFAAVHNVQANTPTENMLAMFRAISDSAGV